MISNKKFFKELFEVEPTYLHELIDIEVDMDL